MTLSGGVWERVSYQRFALEYLRAERRTFLPQVLAAHPGLIFPDELIRILDTPDFDDRTQNHRRLRLLLLMRNRYIGEIPSDTEWYEARNLTDDDVAELYVTRHTTWTDAEDNNEIRAVARRKADRFQGLPIGIGSLILWGHEKNGPFVILEGNHRLVAYVASGLRGLDIPVLVGLSPTPCLWHPLDVTTALAIDLWRD